MEIGSNDAYFDNINVTPLVDVFLVLLIIFMVAASIMTEQAIPVEVPEVSKAPEIQKSQNVTITIEENGRVFIGNDDVPLGGNTTDPVMMKKAEEAGIIQAVNAALSENTDMFVVVRAFKGTQIDRVMEIVDVAKNKADAPNVAIGVAPDESVAPDELE
jgi:biopolymer transport protein ExbD